ncbi:hypothetical protein MKD41_13825 [Lutibacter sp. A64]|uniref:hypothetical protein n=1 Tax=Lutibacter sp. A64 TaxID=2918526 RepID=UPI001F051E3C|nr:hypothetical protein [Lutibacter sp. A64]UMB53400.1 hypothetical protein MKD41_13825 [Lutibacter sp. A64]
MKKNEFLFTIDSVQNFRSLLEIILPIEYKPIRIEKKDFYFLAKIKNSFRSKTSYYLALSAKKKPINQLAKKIDTFIENNYNEKPKESKFHYHKRSKYKIEKTTIYTISRFKLIQYRISNIKLDEEKLDCAIFNFNSNLDK